MNTGCKVFLAIFGICFLCLVVIAIVIGVLYTPTEPTVEFVDYKKGNLTVQYSPSDPQAAYAAMVIEILFSVPESWNL